VTQDRKVYKDQDIEENSTLDICITSFLLHTYCIVIELWLLPEDYQSACDHRWHAPCFPTCHTVAGCWYLLVQYSWLSIKHWISTTLEKKWWCQDCENMKHFMQIGVRTSSQSIKISRILFSLDLSLVALWCPNSLETRTEFVHSCLKNIKFQYLECQKNRKKNHTLMLLRMILPFPIPHA